MSVIENRELQVLLTLFSGNNFHPKGNYVKIITQSTQI